MNCYCEEEFCTKIPFMMFVCISRFAKEIVSCFEHEAWIGKEIS